MKYLGVKALIVIVLATNTAPLWAENPYYFHRSGVSREQYMDDVNDCAELAGGVRVPHFSVTAYGSSVATAAIASGIGSFFAALAEGRERRRMVSRIERTCMADKGYERRSIDKASHAEIKALADEAKIARMFTLVSAEQPTGKVLVE